jgi:hypothetical protein
VSVPIVRSETRLQQQPARSIRTGAALTADDALQSYRRSDFDSLPS